MKFSHALPFITYEEHIERYPSPRKIKPVTKVGDHERNTASDSDVESVASPTKERMDRRHRLEDSGFKDFKKRKAEGEGAGGSPKKTR